VKAERKGADLVLVADAFNEQVVLAAAMVSDAFRAIAVRHPPDVFHVPQHRTAWSAIREAARLGLKPDPATLSRLSSGGVDVAYLSEMLAGRPDVPAEANLQAAVAGLLWDHHRHSLLTGPVNALLEGILKGDVPETLEAKAKAISESFRGWGTREYLYDSGLLADEMADDLRRRMRGEHVYPFGLPGLDYYDLAPGQDPSTARRRILPGAAPGRVTIVTGSTGCGKSTFIARLVLGLARQKRRTLYGSFEKTGKMTLELLACMSLGWSRSELMEGKNLDEEKIQTIRRRALEIGKYVEFMGNPFRRRSGEKLSNLRNLDQVAGYIADRAPDVFVADLFERLLVSDEPSEEKAALFRLQGMAEELKIHAILAAQQRKDIAQRPDKHPTEEGIKGSGAWGEIADNTFGIYRQYQWKPVPDNTLEADILKQRDGRGMLAVEFDWDADRGMLSGGRSIEYERPGSANPNSFDAKLREPKRKSA